MMMKNIKLWWHYYYYYYYYFMVIVMTIWWCWLLETDGLMMMRAWEQKMYQISVCLSRLSAEQDSRRGKDVPNNAVPASGHMNCSCCYLSVVIWTIHVAIHQRPHLVLDVTPIGHDKKKAFGTFMSSAEHIIPVFLVWLLSSTWINEGSSSTVVGIELIPVRLHMAFSFAHTAAASDLWAQRIFNFCAHKVMYSLILIHL
jgi:hypothetical protein